MMADSISFMSMIISVKKRDNLFWEFDVKCCKYYQNPLCMSVIVDFNVVDVN